MTEGDEQTVTNQVDVLAVADLHVSYGKATALRGIDLRVGDGEVVAVLGPNGAGKSTLADAIVGFQEYEGTVEYRGTSVASQSPGTLVSRGLIYCTESRDLFGYLSVEDNLRLGTYRRRGAVTERLAFVYDLFPVLEERADQNARTMSGGEQQMLAIGRALMGDPDLLVLDEPSLGLAPVIRETISDGIDRIRETGVAVLLLEQNVAFGMDHASRVYLVENGRVRREGSPESLEGDEFLQEVYLGD